MPERSGAKSSKEYVEEGAGYAKQCVEEAPQNADCHKWHAIFLDLMGRYGSTKDRIRNSYAIHDSLSFAEKLRPNDAGIKHSLGVWHYEVAALPGWQRTIASYIFATPPTSDFETALRFFESAEALRPKFYVGNLLYLCKTYNRLGNFDAAKKNCHDVLVYQGAGDSELIKAKEEAAKLIKTF